jgi:MSHA biogenesis protein MshQ
LHAPAGGANPAVGAAAGFGAFTAGSATGTDFFWAEVGIVRLVASVGDGDYLGAGNVSGTASERVGRFVPSHFTAALNAPLLQTACGAGGFTYVGQAFGYAVPPAITATARAAGGGVTQNYTGTFFKMATATLASRAYTSTNGTLDLGGVPPTGADPVVAESAPGVATLAFSAATELAFAKNVPQAPFDAALRLGIDVRDADGVVAVGAAPLGNPVTFGAAGGMPFDAGAELRYGRLRLANAHGSELVDLPVPLRAEHYAADAVGFVANAGDSCTVDVTLVLGGYSKNLDAADTCVRDSGAPGASGIGCAAAAPPGLAFRAPPVGGDFNLRLAAPGAGNDGGVRLEADVPAWLRFDWEGAGNDNPAAQITFGIYGGEAHQIYTREIY